MPIPEQHFDIWSMDFISGLPSSQGCNTICIYIDKFTKFVHLIPCSKGEGALGTPECATIFFWNIVRLFGVLKMVFHDHDSRFISNF